MKICAISSQKTLINGRWRFKPLLPSHCLIRILKISLEETRDPRQYNSYQERKSFCNGGNMSGVWCQHTLHNSISIISIKLSIKPVTDRPSYIR